MSYILLCMVILVFLKILTTLQLDLLQVSKQKLMELNNWSHQKLLINQMAGELCIYDPILIRLLKNKSYTPDN